MRVSTLETSFPAGCNTIMQAVTAKGQTPASNSPTDISTAISNIAVKDYYQSDLASIATAITNKGVTTSSSATPSTMATNIGQISTGYSFSDTYNCFCSITISKTGSNYASICGSYTYINKSSKKVEIGFVYMNTNNNSDFSSEFNSQCPIVDIIFSSGGSSFTFTLKNKKLFKKDSYAYVMYNNESYRYKILNFNLTNTGLKFSYESNYDMFTSSNYIAYIPASSLPGSIYFYGIV